MSSEARARHSAGSAASILSSEADESIEANSRHQMSAFGAGMIEAVGSMSSASPDSRMIFIANEWIVDM